MPVRRECIAPVLRIELQLLLPLLWEVFVDFKSILVQVTIVYCLVVWLIRVHAHTSRERMLVAAHLPMSAVDTMGLLMLVMVLLIVVMMLLRLLLLLLLMVLLMWVFVPNSLHIPLVATTSSVEHAILHLVWIIHAEWVRGLLRDGRSGRRRSLVAIRASTVIHRRRVSLQVSRMSLLLVVISLLLSGPSTVMPVGTIGHLLVRIEADVAISFFSSPLAFGSVRRVSYGLWKRVR